MVDLDLWQRIQNLRGGPASSVADDLLGDLSHRRRQEREAELPVPFCCPLVAGIRVVRAVMDESLGRPSWRSSFWIESATHGSHPVSHCPFCGTGLPGFRLKAEPPAHLTGGSGESPRCSLCSSRWDACLCSLEESAWEVDNAPPVGAAVGLVRRSGFRDRREEFLSSSRKTDHESKGLPGGKLDEGETPEQALVRELEEETGVVVQEFHRVLDLMDDSGTRSVFFSVTRYEGEPRSMEKGLVEWLPPEDLVTRSLFGRSNLSLMKRIDPHGTAYRV